MKSLLRNLMFVARRYRLSVVLNLLGLTAAFMVFVALLMQIDYDRSYNAALADADRIAMPCNIPPKNSDFEKFSSMSFPIMELIGGQPHVESYTYILGDCYEETFYINEHFCSGTFMMCAPNFADFYNLDIVVGDKKCLDANQVMIPESFAKKYFGDASPLGKSINKAKTWIVGAVYRDIHAKNTWLRNPVLRVIDKSWFGDNLTNPNMNSFTMFIKADKAENFPAIQASANKQFEEICKGNEWFGNTRKEFVLIPLTETHYNSDFILVGEQIKASNEKILLSIALLILLIAAINFANFSNALIPMRVRSINTQKILGATQSSLRLYLTAEAAGIAFTAFIIAVGGLLLLSHTEMNQLTVAGINPFGNLHVLGLSAATAIVAGVLAGLAPAWRITSFAPAVALKGNFGLSPRGKAMRTAMIGLQFFISASLIVSALLMQRQRDYLVNSADYGFLKDELIVCDITRADISEPQTAVEALKRLPMVADASLSWSVAGRKDNSQGWVFHSADGDEVAPRTLFATAGYCNTMGIKIVDGRDFCASDTNAIILNKLARDKYNSSVDVGKCLMFGGTQFPIVGICDNAKFSSLHSKTEPVMIVLSKDFNCDNLTVRVKKGANMFDAASKIRTELTKFNAEYPFEMQFYNKILDDTYKNEMRLTNQISVFSLLAIAISIMGVFGLVVFDSEYRRREIAVRKVFGSSTADVVAMFNLKYLKILAVSFIPAVPLSYWFVNRWLEEFAYRISIGWMVYAATFIALAALTAATVTYQCWRTARANPVDSLHAE